MLDWGAYSSFAVQRAFPWAEWLHATFQCPEANPSVAGAGPMTTRLEILKPDALANAILAEEVVLIVSDDMLGDAACWVEYRGQDCALGEQLLFRTSKATLEQLSGDGMWCFAGDRDLLRLVSETEPIQLDHLFDPYVTMSSDNALELNHSVASKEQAIKKVEEVTTAVASCIPETSWHLQIPCHHVPGPIGAQWDEKLSSGKGRLGQRSSEKCELEDLLFHSLCAHSLRNDLNHFIRVEKPHVRVLDLIEWCHKYLYLPRFSSDHIILDALMNPAAAFSVDSTYHWADSFDEASGRYICLRAQQVPSTQPSCLTVFIVKDELALSQIEADQLTCPRVKEQAATPALSVSTTGYNLVTVSDVSPEVARPGFTSGSSSTTETPAAVGDPPKPQLHNRYVASVKLDPSCTSLQMSAFVDEVMSHLKALPCAQFEMSSEVQVNAPDCIDGQSARIVRQNSAALKIEKPGLY